MPVRYEDILGELRGLTSTLRTLAAKEGDPTEDEVWPVYASMERLVAILKLRMKEDRLGTALRELPRSKTPREFIPAALGFAERGAESLGKGELAPGLQSMRESRTNLRAYLAEINRARMREKRKARTTRPS